MQKQINTVVFTTLVVAMGIFLLCGTFALVGLVFVIKLLSQTKVKWLEQLDTRMF